MKPYSFMPMVLMLGFGVAAQAQPPYPAGAYGPGGYGPGAYGSAPVRRTNPSAEAAAVLREGMEKLLAFLGQEDKPNKLQVAAFLDKDIAPYFDFDYMAKWVAGPRASDMSEEQRKSMSATLEARFLSTLAGNLAKYKGQQVRFFPPRMYRGGAASVSVGILRPGGYPSKLDFRMYKAEDGWKIYDVVANGRSAAAFYRADLNRKAAQSGAGPSGR